MIDIPSAHQLQSHTRRASITLSSLLSVATRCPAAALRFQPMRGARAITWTSVADAATGPAGGIHASVDAGCRMHRSPVVLTCC